MFSISGSVAAQSAFPTVFPKPVLIIDQTQLFNESKLGLAILLEVAQERTALLHESRAIDDAFEAEELSLTEKRPLVTPEDFRLLSDDFDTRVQAARETQLTKAQELQQALDTQEIRFLRIATPYLGEIMTKYFAGAILDKRSVVLFNRDMDITAEAIAILDQAFAANPDMIDQN